MKEISLNVLDIVENSVKAKAKNIEILMTEQDSLLTVVIKDDGCGMEAETVKRVENPFYTTRTTRAVGLGIPFFKLAAEQTGGSFRIESISEKVDSVRHGTTVTTVFHTDHIDFMPIGDMVSTICTLIQGAPAIDFLFRHEQNDKVVLLDTKQMREILGEDVPLDQFEVISWIRQYLLEQYE